MSLDVRVRLRLGALDLDVTLRTRGGETVALAGANGAGKTTLLRALAGVIPIDEGRVALDGEVLEDTAARRHVAAERRGVAMVFQGGVLLPHLTALGNVCYGLRARGCGAAEARERSLEWLRRLGVERHAGLRPAALSGGEVQRVALAQALVTAPRMLLLDEPLAAVDGPSRAGIRELLRAELDGFDGVCIVVTHDPLEARALASRVVTLDHGRVAGDTARERGGRLNSGAAPAAS